MDRFWGDDSGMLLLFGGVCRWIFMDKLCGGPGPFCCGGDSRIFGGAVICGDSVDILCGDIRKLCGLL